MLRTQTRANHEPGRRDVYWGLDAKLTIFGIVVTLLLAIGAAWVSINRDIAAIMKGQETQQRDINNAIPRAEYEHHNHRGRVPSEGR